VSRYYEDFTVGERFELGSRTLTREEIIAFATEWDPQEFHTGERDSAFGEGVIASGVHTIAVWMRMFVDNVLKDTAVVAGKTVEQIRMLVPVRPGMALQGSAEVIGLEDSSRDDRGVVAFRGMLHHEGELVWDHTSAAVVARRPVIVASESKPDPVTLTLQVPETEGVEDALWELDEEGPVVVSAIVPDDDGVLTVVVEGQLEPDDAIAFLREAVPALEISGWTAGRLAE
jgi:acyl dehydratase